MALRLLGLDKKLEAKDMYSNELASDLADGQGTFPLVLLCLPSLFVVPLLGCPTSRTPCLHSVRTSLAVDLCVICDARRLCC